MFPIRVKHWLNCRPSSHKILYLKCSQKRVSASLTDSEQIHGYRLNSKRNANVCSDPVQSHYDEKFMHDNRSTSENEIRAKCSLDICLSNCTSWYSLYTFLHTPPVSKTANVKTWLTFIQSNIANLICFSFAVQYICDFMSVCSIKYSYNITIRIWYFIIDIRIF